MYIQKDANGNIVNMTQMPQIAEGGEWSEVADDAPEVLAFLAPPNNLVASAKVALEATDMVAIRCLKAGVEFPSAWKTYVIELRAIANGTDMTSTALPAQPDFPAGT